MPLGLRSSIMISYSPILVGNSSIVRFCLKNFIKDGRTYLPCSKRLTVDEFEESCGSCAKNNWLIGSFRFSKSDWKKGGSGRSTMTVKENGF